MSVWTTVLKAFRSMWLRIQCTPAVRYASLLQHYGTNVLIVFVNLSINNIQVRETGWLTRGTLRAYLLRYCT